MSSPQFDTIIFDVGKVLYQWDARLLVNKLADDPKERAFLADEVLGFAWHMRTDEGESIDDLVVERIAQYPDYEFAMRAYRARFLETIPGPVPGMLDLVRQLAAKNYPIYGITNFGSEFWDMFRPTAPIFDLFTDIIVSGKEKIAKPDLAIYALAIEKWSLNPVKSLFIDDRDENIAAAKQAGLGGHIFKNHDELAVYLQNNGCL